MKGNTKDKRMQQSRKKVYRSELKFRTTKQKKYFQRKVRRNLIDLSDEKLYRKVSRHEKWKYVSYYKGEFDICLKLEKLMKTV